MGYTSEKFTDVSSLDLRGLGSGLLVNATQIAGMVAWATATLLGTTNQVTITPGGGGTTLTFSLPQNIHTAATPTFAGLTLAALTLTSFSGLLKASSGVVSAIADGTANQVFGRNNANNNYEYKTISGTADQITVTHGANSITFSLPQSINTTSSPTFAGLTVSGNLHSNAYYTAGGTVNFGWHADYSGAFTVVSSPSGASLPGNFRQFKTTRTADLTLGGNFTDMALRIDNAGAGANVAITLPAAQAGFHYSGVVMAAFRLTFDAAGTDVIRDAASVSSAGGTIYSNTVGDWINLYCPVDGTWVVVGKAGTWTLT